MLLWEQQPQKVRFIEEFMAVKVQDTILFTFCEDLFEANQIMEFIEALIAKYGSFLKIDGFQGGDIKSPEKFASALWQKSRVLVKTMTEVYYKEFDTICLFKEFEVDSWIAKANYVQFCKINQLLGVTVKKFLEDYSSQESIFEKNPNLIKGLSQAKKASNSIKIIDSFVVQGYGLWQNQIHFQPAGVVIDEMKSAFSLMLRLAYAKNWVTQSPQL